MRSPIAVAFAVLALPVVLGAGAGTASKSAASAATAPGTPREPALEIVHQGSVTLEGHYARPGDVRRFESQRRFLADGKGALRMEWATWAAGDTDRIPETVLLTRGRVYDQEAPGAPWEELAGSRAYRARLQVLSGFPTVLAQHGADFGVEVERSGDRVIAGRARRAHPRLGDVVDSVRYYYGDGSDPVKLALRIHERDQVWSLEELRVSSRQIPLPDSLFAPPREVTLASLDPDSLRGQPAIREIAPGVFSVEMEDIDSRSLVVEFSDYLAVIEVAVSSANGERLVDAIDHRWAKPIRYVLVSHHHPHYVGGLRAMIAEGATVVTTPGNARLVRQISDYPFRLRPDRLARSPKAVALFTFDRRFDLTDATNKLVAINIGDRSQHTAEFVVFWLPKQRLLFETELGWVTVNGTVRATRRAAGLLATIDEEKLDVDRLVQSWPMRGNKAEMSRAELAALVLAQAQGAGRSP